MADNVVKLYPANAADNPDNVLEQAIGEYGDVLLIGRNVDGSFDMRMSVGLENVADVIMLLERSKHEIMMSVCEAGD